MIIYLQYLHIENAAKVKKWNEKKKISRYYFRIFVIKLVSIFKLDDRFEPPLPKSIIGSKIARATFFVKNNKVTHNVLLKVHHVVDERDVIHNVLLFPKPVCTCVEKKNCCHILAVEYTLGKPIGDAYKMQNLRVGEPKEVRVTRSNSRTAK